MDYKSDNHIIDHKINQHQKRVAQGVPQFVVAQRLVIKHPVALGNIVARPADDVGRHVGIKPRPAQHALAKRKYTVGQREKGKTAGSVFPDLQNDSVFDAFQVRALCLIVIFSGKICGASATPAKPHQT